MKAASKFRKARLAAQSILNTRLGTGTPLPFDVAIRAIGRDFDSFGIDADHEEWARIDKKRGQISVAG